MSAIKKGSPRWHNAAIGGAGCFVFGAPVLLIAMSMEPTSQDLQTAAWILAIVGMFTFASLYARLRYINIAEEHAGKNKESRHALRLRARKRRLLSFFAWFNLGVIFLCGLVWVLAAKAQCLIQGWILGLVVAEGCT